MFGFLNIYKPKGITSHDVIYRVRKILNIKKVGHAGTLDPLAEGVLPVAVGGATRLIDYLPTDKEYIADVKFGYISDTFDAEGKIEKFSDIKIQKEELEKVLMSFCGEISQKPPIYSAVKINGKKLYDYARNGIETEIPDRIVKIDRIELTDFDENNNTAKILISCSKGTYIRSVVNDMGILLKSGAYMTRLVRTLSSGMKVENSVIIENICENMLISPTDIINFPIFEVNSESYEKVKCGNPVKAETKDGLTFIIYNSRIISIAEIRKGIAYSKKVFL